MKRQPHSFGHIIFLTIVLLGLTSAGIAREKSRAQLTQTAIAPQFQFHKNRIIWEQPILSIAGMSVGYERVFKGGHGAQITVGLPFYRVYSVNPGLIRRNVFKASLVKGRRVGFAYTKYFPNLTRESRLGLRLQYFHRKDHLPNFIRTYEWGAYADGMSEAPSENSIEGQICDGKYCDATMSETRSVSAIHLLFLAEVKVSKRLLIQGFGGVGISSQTTVYDIHSTREYSSQGEDLRISDIGKNFSRSEEHENFRFIQKSVAPSLSIGFNVMFGF